MRAKKIGLIAVVALALVCLLTMNASAAWYYATVHEVGSTATTICVKLSDNATSPAFTKTWFYLAGERDKEMLAACLTAKSLGKNVLVNAQGTEHFSTVKGIYLTDD